MVEPSSGKAATATTTVTVHDQDDLYSSTGVYSPLYDAVVSGETVLFNPAGDSDFSWGSQWPEAIQVVMDEPGYENTLESAYYTGNDSDPILTKKANDTWSDLQSGAASGAPGYKPRRYLFKRGGNYHIRLMLHAFDDCDILIGAYGNPADPKPVLNYGSETIDTTYRRIFSWSGSWGGGSGRFGEPVEARFVDVKLQHTFNPSVTNMNTQGSHTRVGVWGTTESYLVFTRVDFNGIAASNIYVSGPDGNNSVLHVNDCTATNFGGQYAFMHVNSNGPRGVCMFTGVRAAQNPNAIAAKWDEGLGGYRSLMRFGTRKQIIYGCDLFSIMQNFQIIKLGDGAFDSQDNWAYDLLIGRTVAEGMAELATINSNQVAGSGTDHNRPHENNCVISDSIYLSGYERGSFATTQGTGVTIRNCMYIVPPVPHKQGNTMAGFLRIRDTEAYTGSTVPPSYILDAPIEVYNCTYYCAATQAQIANTVTPRMLDQSTPNYPMTNVTESNNLMHFPNYGDSAGGAITTYAPLSSNVLFQARNAGYTDPANDPNYTTDATYATPADTIIDVRPLTGSTAIGASVGSLIAYKDIGRVTRPEPASIGAWEVS